MFPIIANWKNRKVLSSVSVDELYNRVVNPSEEYKYLINELRSNERKSEKYNSIKEELPCFSAAFKFNGYINKGNATIPTGYIYIDIDDEDNIDLNHPSVAFYCKSVSGKGYSVLVGVIGVTKDTIKQVTLSVAKELDLKLDLDAVSTDRLTVISYDINAYYNPEHTYFLYENGILKNPHYNTIHNIYISNEYNGGKIRKNNLDEIIAKTDFNGELKIDYGKNGLQYTELITPFKDVEEGHRNSTMNTICYLIKGLNPNIDKPVIKSYLESINISKFKPALSDKEINSIIDSIFRIEKIELKPNRYRRFLYNPDYNLSTSEKRRENLISIRNDRVEKTLTDLELFIENWDYKLNGKITQKSLSNVSGKNIKTIEKYYNKFKDKIKDKNLEFIK